MKKLMEKVNMAFVLTKFLAKQKKEAVDQIIIMFIIVAVAAGIAGLVYIFGTDTLLPNFQNKITELINQWFSHS